MSTANWNKVGRLESIPVRGARRLCSLYFGRPVAVFRTGDDQIFALVDECPHKKGPLSEGIIAGDTVACPLHGMVIGLQDGVAVAPDEGAVKTVPVSVIEGEVYLHLPEPGAPG
ncbi:nitrite reductase (NAD(P)H) small subunit [Rhizomicrobium electricum]|uniref:Nitrite reductase small subunit NirD n=1 Tax=Rhizomicrobium electricum TaxID=480070 RepID=A0ABP3PR22_9PROT|nr:nitrite reductase (NADH) small subunit [Rhizomicrobium electricum]